MAEQAASDTSKSSNNNNNNNNNNNGSRAVMLFGADISSPPSNNLQERNSIDTESSNDVDASATDGISINRTVGNKAVSSLRARKGKAGRERKKGKPWTEDEHLKFLAGLKKFGKGNWRNISRDFVPTRTPMQVATHAQKHFNRQAVSGKKLRTSIFDMTLDELAGPSPASTSRDTDEAPSQTAVPAEIRKVHPTAPPPYHLPANPPLATYGLPNYLGISYPAGFHFDRKCTTPTNNTMLKHPWVAFYYRNSSLV